MEDSQVHIIGIRHHGPGSARLVEETLALLLPDIVLIEGPPDANGLIEHVADQEMTPPVVLMLYSQEDLSRGVFYPFAEFSPEWRALRFGVKTATPLRFIDLPVAHQFAITDDREESTDFDDPLMEIARAGGYEDKERWWETTFEHRERYEEQREAIFTLMSALRDHYTVSSQRELLREAYMRSQIRAARAEGFTKIAVICGAWHVPALQTMPPKKEDDLLLKKLPKVKIGASWVPWTYDRLSLRSGYGAGIRSPGWYDHLWHHPKATTELWMVKMARLLREKGIDVSPAHLIEATRAAEALASLRSLPRPGLPELQDAARAVLCFGDDTLLAFIHEHLVVGRVMGSVPSTAPKLPLEADLETQRKGFRLKFQERREIIDLDLRETTGRAKSALFHRLSLLEIEWGKKLPASGRGTFKEQWELRWHPELHLKITEQAVWGNTIEEAAISYSRSEARKSHSLERLCHLLATLLPADLPSVIDEVIAAVTNLAALAVDVTHLMSALPPLVLTARYGDVRNTNTEMIVKLVEGITIRICVGLPAACTALDEEQSEDIFDKIKDVHESLTLLSDEALHLAWANTLTVLSTREEGGDFIGGGATRLLFRMQRIDEDEVARRLIYALSPGNDWRKAAGWIDGFLSGNAYALLFNDTLFALIDRWIANLPVDAFLSVLPALRRSFSEFSTGERRKLKEKAFAGRPTQRGTKDVPGQLDHERAKGSLNVIADILGL